MRVMNNPETQHSKTHSEERQEVEKASTQGQGVCKDQDSTDDQDAPYRLKAVAITLIDNKLCRKVQPSMFLTLTNIVWRCTLCTLCRIIQNEDVFRSDERKAFNVTMKGVLLGLGLATIWTKA